MSYNAPQFNKDVIYAVRTAQPIKKCGLTLYPIMMRDYDEFILCKDALAIMQSSLPAAYLAMDFLSALFAFALDEVSSPETAQHSPEKTAAFQRVLRLLYLALRSTDTIDDISKNIVYTQKNERTAIAHIKIHQNEETIELTPSVFSGIIRPLIAYQNGIELPDERDNPDLIKELKKYQNSDDSVNLRVNADDLISSVAYQSKVTETEIISTWTVRQFEYRVRAIERDKRYSLCGAAEMSGFASFEKGNPHPSWCYDVDADMPGTTSLSEIGKKLGGAGVKAK